MFQIYGLIDPISKELRYIGKSIDYLERYFEHLLPSSLIKKSYKNFWLKSLMAQNLKPEVIILDIANSNDEANEKEIELISYYKFVGCELTNGTLGGDGRYGFKTSQEVKEKIKTSMKGKNVKPQIKANCLFCEKEFQFRAKYKKRGHKFCSLLCANRHNNSLKTRIPV